MNKLTELIQDFDKVDDWQGLVRQNFERKSGTYSYVTVTKIEVHIDSQVFHYPTKVVFEYGYVKSQRDITKNEKVVINKRQIKIIERKRIIPLSFYQRSHKYTGEIFQIIKDIVGRGTISEGLFSSDLLTPSDNPLFAIDSNQKWASYLLVLQKTRSLANSNISLDRFDSSNNILNDYGIHYDFDPSLRDSVIVIFPMPYLKVVENKIKKKESGESIFLVIEFNQLGIFYSSSIKIEIDGLIKDVKKNTIYKKVESIKFGKAKYQVVELEPKEPSEIGFAAISIKINGTLVDKFSGYYIRDIKLDIKAR